MTSPFSALLLFAFLASACSAQTHHMNEISKNGMTVSWEIDGENLRVAMSAPTTGWVAIGFNTSDQLTGTNLLMGCVIDEKALLSDRFIIAPGTHRSMEEVGGSSAAVLISGTETASSTTIRFTLPLQSADKWHYDLKPGKKYNLLLAFSREDDFAHHSMMRTSIEITL